MGYQRSDYRYGGDDRWRDRDRDRNRSYGRGYERGYGSDDDDRGFFDRAGDEVRSWFGDEEAQRRREMDERRWERERAERGDWYGRETGGGWGNQRGDSWRRERPGEAGYLREGGWTDENIYGAGRYGGGAPDHGRRFDRIDAGSTGTHGVHPMSSASGEAYGSGYGSSAYGYGSSASRYSAMSGRRGADVHDPHYAEWRNRQIDELDRDYDDYRREHQSRFEQEFGNWRSRRQTQRQSLGRVAEHMEVIGSDGEKIGTVDKVRGDRIILTKSDENAGGAHHSIPCSWIESVDDKVIVDKSAQEAMDAWRNEERSRALFEREDSGSDGPHALNRSFSGTY